MYYMSVCLDKLAFRSIMTSSIFSILPNMPNLCLLKKEKTGMPKRLVSENRFEISEISWYISLCTAASKNGTRLLLHINNTQASQNMELCNDRKMIQIWHGARFCRGKYMYLQGNSITP